MSINLLSKEIETEKYDKVFWRNVGVPIDMILELTTTEVNDRINIMLHNTPVEELIELATQYNISLTETKKQDILAAFSTLGITDRREILLLKEFLIRKKRTVIDYYNNKVTKEMATYEKSQIAQLGYLVNDCLSHIAEIFTWFTWDSKASGQVYAIQENVTFEKTFKIPTEYRKHLVDFLHKESKYENEYKIFSYATNKDKVLVRIHRKVNDASRFDFDEPFRNKEVAPILFLVDIKESTLEIRTKYKLEVYWLKKYIEETFKTTLTEISPEIFTNYTPSEVKSAFLEAKSASGKEVVDFLVNKVVFRGSPIKNSPAITFYIENADVIPSLKDAHERQCIDLDSIKDIESLSFKSSIASRSVRSILLDDGNIIFTIDDSGLDPITKKKIETKFFERFGIPLNRKISNAKFSDGKADVIDYLMGQSSKIELTEFEEEIFVSLLSDGFIEEVQGASFSCENPNCDFYKEGAANDTPLNECPNCGNNKIKKSHYSTLQINEKHNKKYIEDWLKGFCKSSKWSFGGVSERTIADSKYQFYVLDNKNGETIQVLIYNGSLSTRIINKINSYLTPTIIICPGTQEKYLEKYNADCIIPLSLGKIMASKERYEILEKLYKTFKHRAKHYISSAAYKSFEILSNMPEPSKIDKGYKSGDFEDDTFNLLIDIFPNSERWGNRMTGKEVPEGIFTLTYKEPNGEEDEDYRYVFSFDCKLNKTDKGYDLSKDEQRKAFDYAESLNRNNYIFRYSKKKQLSSHVFISNNFNENNYKTMAEHFYRKQAEQNNKYSTRPIFLKIEALTHLHSLYRQNFNIIRNARNIFYKELYAVLTTDNYVVTTQMIDDVFEKALDLDLADYRDLNTTKVKSEILQKLK